MVVLGYLAKLKSGLGLAFDVHFLHDLFIKMFLISLPMGKASMSHVISIIKIFLGSTSKAMADREKGGEG